MSSSTSVVRSLKVVYGSDLRRFPVADGKLPALSVLTSQLAQAYSLEQIALKYLDDEEDQVTVVTDDDLKEAVNIAAGQGKSIVRLYVYSTEAAKTADANAATTPVPPPAVKTVQPEATPQASAPTPASVPAAYRPRFPTATSSSPSSEKANPSAEAVLASIVAAQKPKPSAEAVLASIKEFFGNQATLAALPTAVSLFLDTLVSTTDVSKAIQFTLDSQPALKATSLVALGMAYLDVALPYIESAVGPLRSWLTSLGASGMNQIKATIQTFSLFVLPVISGVVARLTPANLVEAWSIIQAWARDPSQPFPIHQLKSIVGFGGCGLGGFGRAFGGFGRPGHQGRHCPGPFGNGGGWRRRAAEAEAQSQSSPAAAAPFDPMTVIFDMLGAGATQAGAGIESVLGQFAPRQQQPASDSSASSSSVPSTSEETNKANPDGVHPNIICDMCGMSPIKGLRFKCTVCHDYDLCSSCEAKNVHDATHPLLKLHAPAPQQQKRCGGYNWMKHVHGGHHHGGRHGAWREAAANSTGPSMKFVKDLNIHDRSPVGPNVVLIKKWLLENDGAMAWPQGTKLIFMRGDRELVDGEEFPVTPAEAGSQVEVSAVLKTPSTPGRYQAFFRLADSDRNTFGNRIWCDLFVVPESKPTAASASAPAAEQKSVEPVVTIPVASPVAVQLNEVVSAPAPAPAPTPVLVKPTIEEPKQVPAPALVKPVIESPASASSSPAATAEPTGKYATELALLAGMGFKNAELNTFLLDSKQGDLVAVANWLLEKMK